MINKKVYPKGWLKKIYIEAEIFDKLFLDNDNYKIEESQTSSREIIPIVRRLD